MSRIAVKIGLECLEDGARDKDHRQGIRGGVSARSARRLSSRIVFAVCISLNVWLASFDGTRTGSWSDVTSNGAEFELQGWTIHKTSVDEPQVNIFQRPDKNDSARLAEKKVFFKEHIQMRLLTDNYSENCLEFRGKITERAKYWRHARRIENLRQEAKPSLVPRFLRVSRDACILFSLFYFSHKTKTIGSLTKKMI